jgi:hypothetical protein
MSNVLIIAEDCVAAHRLRESLMEDGHVVALARDLVAALPELYLSPCALKVILSGNDAERLVQDARALAAADRGPLGRHSYSTLASFDMVPLLASGARS